MSDLRRFVNRYVVFYVVFIILLLILPLTLGRLGNLVYEIVTIPILLALALSLIGNIVKLSLAHRPNLRPDLMSYLVGRLINSLILTYLLINNAISALIKYYPGSSHLIMGVLGFVVFIIMGIIVEGSKGSLSNYLGYNSFIKIRYFLELLTAALILYGFSLLMTIVYAPLSYSFIIPSIASFLLSLISILSVLVKGAGIVVINNVLKSSKTIVASFFGIGLLYSLLSIPKPSIWNLYILALFIIMASLIIAYMGYRMYVNSNTFIESIENEVYEAHKRSIRVIDAPDLKPLIDSVEEFVRHGKKELLLMYLTFILSNNGYDFNEIQDKLSRLIYYSSLKEQGVKIRRSLIDAEIKDRINLVNELLTQVLSNDQSRNKGRKPK